MDLLRVKGLRVGFQQQGVITPVLAGVDFSIAEGETVVLVGESGSGKSLTALSTLRLLPENAVCDQNANILWRGQDLLKMPEAKMRSIRGRHIAMIFQEPMTSLNPVLSIEQQIYEVLHTHFSTPRKAAREQIIELLTAVGVPAASERLHHFPHQLSGGMKQRVMIAMALAGQPGLLIADEATTALDVTVQQQVLALLKKLQSQFGMSILLITHDLGVANVIADRVLVMYAGHIVESAPRDQFFSNPQHPYSKKLFEALPTFSKRHQLLSSIPGQIPPIASVMSQCRFAQRCESSWDLCYQQNPRWLKTSRTHGVRCHLYDPKVHVPQLSKKSEEPNYPSHSFDNLLKTTGPLLQVDHLKVHFPLRKGLLQRIHGHVFAVDDISLELYPGKTLAIVGESGCGKTTLALAILQLLPVTSGRVVYQKSELGQLSSRDLRQIRCDLQIVFQDPFSSMDPRMMVKDIIAEGVDSLKLLSSSMAREERINSLLIEVGLSPEIKHRYPHEFSGGQRQRIAIARALAVQPKIIICDEPTSALDVSVQAQILNLLLKLQKEHGLAFLFITHNLAVVSYLADNICVMYLGKIVEQGPAEAILKNPKHPYTQALLKSVPSLSQGAAQPSETVKGELPSSISPPSGCHFHPRCPFVMPQCHLRYPYTATVGEGHTAACYLYPLEESESKHNNVVSLSEIKNNRQE